MSLTNIQSIGILESEFIQSFDFTSNFPDEDVDWKTRSGHVSASALKRLKISPSHFIEQEKTEKTDALIFGGAYHCFILEPEKFDKEYFIFDERDIIEKLLGEGAKSPRGTNAYKEWKEAQISFAQGKIMLDLETYEALKAMKERLMANRYIRNLLAEGKPEQSFFCTIKSMDGHESKIIIKPDFLKYDKRAVIELKTAIDGSKDGFPRACAEFDYHIQASLYTDFMGLITAEPIPWSFYYIVQESKRPYAYNLFEASPQYLAQGRYEYEQLIMLFNQCKEKSHWPGYQVWCQNRFGINQLDLPKWGIKDLTFYNHKI